MSNTHVENIQGNLSKHLNILRSLTYRLSDSNLATLYIVYIRPLFEYACELWDWKFTQTGPTSTGSCQNCYMRTYVHKNYNFICRNRLGITICETEEKDNSTFFL